MPFPLLRWLPLEGSFRVRGRHVASGGRILPKVKRADRRRENRRDPRESVPEVWGASGAAPRPTHSSQRSGAKRIGRGW